MHILKQQHMDLEIECSRSLFGNFEKKKNQIYFLKNKKLFSRFKSMLDKFLTKNSYLKTSYENGVFFRTYFNCFQLFVLVF